MMIARPILFSASMIRALLDGRKTQTRRTLKTQPLDILPMPKAPGREWVVLEQREPESRGKVIRCRFGLPGDLLWVREAWRVSRKNDGNAPRDLNYERGMTIMYADGGSRAHNGQHEYENDFTYPGLPLPDWAGRYRHARFMPRWASRLTLRITEVRVQRLQDISDADAIAEGITMPEPEREERDLSLCAQCGGTLLINRVHPVSGGMMFDSDCTDCSTARDRYRHLWNFINGRDAWGANPFVWCLTFEVIRANVDEVMRRQATVAHAAKQLKQVPA